MNVSTLLSVLVLALATYLSAVALAMLMVSPSELAARAERGGRAARSKWYIDHDDDARLAVSLVRTLSRLAFFAMILVEFTGLGPESRVSVLDLVTAGLLSTLLLWVATVVLASAVARHACVGLIFGSIPLLRVLTLISWPLIRAFGFIDEAVRRLSGANLRAEEEVAEESILRSIEDTHREGGLDEQSAEMLENIVEFSSTTVGEVMTPRTDVDGLEYTDDLQVIRITLTNVGHSRLPVYRENLDHVVGILYVKDLLPWLGVMPTEFRLESLLRTPAFVPETKPVQDLLEEFQKSETHLAIVIDEYGGTAGLVTIEDLLEEIVGEIQDEHDEDEPDAPEVQAIDPSRAEVDGRVRIVDLNEELKLDLPEDEDYDTIAGFMLSHLGRVPAAGEAVEAHGARFITLSATPTTIERVEVKLLAPVTEP